ncbi:nuclear transport factor 2 family protein [Fulvivirga ulvae]|uniref:nuclear transport factor 2 family protein n=1 Tax=Fulvivirga ulvae TaxID=2904245 RepID=UPI001F276E43|nr:nuclear transport factor 2 family protein [Fulvivirga ulvae]UII31480.1 nuclear transport factor 2 family protein [Fulvivirga ulvae]
MKNCRTNLTWSKAGTTLHYHISSFAIIMSTAWLILAGCTGLESNQYIDPVETGTELNSVSTYAERGQVTKKCADIGQEITDRNTAIEAAFAAKDLDLLYNNFWTPTYYEFGPFFDKDRDELLVQMISFYTEREGELFSYELESYDRFVHGSNLVYDFGAYDNLGRSSGNDFEIHGYYCIRWVKGSDGLWRIDRTLSGSRGNNTNVNTTIDEGPVACSKKDKPGCDGHDDEAYEEIADQLEAYIEALTTGDTDEAYEFYTHDFRNIAPGLEVDRDGLNAYYLQFFETGSIVSLDFSMRDRFIHDDVAYDFGYFEKTTIVNGIQSVEKNNYVLRWEKSKHGHHNVWRIDRIFNVPRPY